MPRRRYLLLILLGLAIVAGLVNYWLTPSDTAWNEWKGVEDPRPIPSPFVVTDKGIARQDSTGRVVWFRAMAPHYARRYVRDSERIYVPDGHGIAALDAVMGWLAWYQPGPCDKLCFCGNLLVAMHQDGHSLVARSCTTGTEVFRVQLPMRMDCVGCVADQIIVQSWVPSQAWVIDSDGRVRHHFDLWVLDACRIDEDRIFLTTHGLIREGTTSWAVQPTKGHLPEGGIRLLSDGDVLAFWYDRWMDSGVEVVRVNSKTGEVTWESSCLPLGVRHARYHCAKLETREATARITGQSSSGTFFEILDLQTGRQLKRDVTLSRSGWLAWLPW